MFTGFKLLIRTEGHNEAIRWPTFSILFRTPRNPEGIAGNRWLIRAVETNWYTAHLSLLITVLHFQNYFVIVIQTFCLWTLSSSQLTLWKLEFRVTTLIQWVCTSQPVNFIYGRDHSCTWIMRSNIELDRLINEADVIRFSKAHRSSWLNHVKRTDSSRIAKRMETTWESTVRKTKKKMLGWCL